MVETDADRARHSGQSARRSAWAAVTASVLGAGAMTACCILPLALVSVGITGTFIGQMTALYQYKWITFAISAAFLGWGFWQVYRPVRCADGSCAVPLIPRRVMKAILWGAAVVMAAGMVFPYLYDPFAGF